MPEDCRPATLPDDLDLQARGLHQIGHGLGAGVDLGLVEGREGHAGDPGERLEILAQGGHEVSDPRSQGAQSGRVEVWGENVVGHHPRVPTRARTPAGDGRYEGSQPHDIQ